MAQVEKYIWLIDTIRRAGKISHRDLSDMWERNRELSGGQPLHRATFNRWKDAILTQFHLIIECQRVGGYLYYIANPEDIDENELGKWMLDSFAMGNLIGDNLELKDRILVEQIPSGRYHLTTLLDAMKTDRVVVITYKAFKYAKAYTFPVEPYCVKLFENRWYLLGRNINKNCLRLYGLDRIEEATVTEQTFKLPSDFSPANFFANYFGVVLDDEMKPRRIVIRANSDHAPYLKSLPLHASQQVIEDNGEYVDFELYLVPTYDFVMKLLQVGAMVEVIKPLELRKEMKGWATDLFELYKND